MTVVRSLSVGNGDMFYIRHSSDNFTIIDCCMANDICASIVDDVRHLQRNKGVTRFISTHPDDDHIRGLKYLDDQLGILNFYCVANAATKQDYTEDFDRYCGLRDSDKAFHICAGCTRRWMNQGSDERGDAGIHVLWPLTDNPYYKQALREASNGGSPNNISPILKYSQADGATFLWMGDLESDFMDNISNSVALPNVDVLFAPHHGRHTGKVPARWLEQMVPKIVIIGEAPSGLLDYYQGYRTITQNTAGHITFECDGRAVHIYVSSQTYRSSGLANWFRANDYGYYIGTLEI